jgi:alpha-ketoglutarate-dependent taurine dioxygenase
VITREQQTVVDLLPVVLTPGDGDRIVSADGVVAWATARRAALVSDLHECGALLLRGFPIHGAADFEALATVFCGELANYVGGNSPRTRIQGSVFTTTEYSQTEKISLHNEGSYLRRMPRVILFHCEVAPVDRGQTPLADSRRIYQAMSPAVRDRFASRRVRYINNLHDGGGGIGKAWPTVFQTSNRREVERRLAADGYEFEWKRDGGLRTSIVADAVALHPETRVPVWINQAEQWHLSSLNPKARAALASIMPERDFPHHACFADGSPFDEADLAHIRAVMADEERVFQWQPGDVLLCDNYLVMHGRQPFTGPRRILAAMG